jgi:site-specific recombinase XerD
MRSKATLAGSLQGFFTGRLIGQRRVSPHTVASYRDTFRLLLRFAQRRLKTEPSKLGLAEIDAPLLIAFLDYLEKVRGNGARSRNARLAAIHSFFRYVALQEPEHAAQAQRVLAIPCKRYARRPIDYLTSAEVEALLQAPDRETWGGRRDAALLLVAVETGLRLSELIGLRCDDVVLSHGAHVRCEGKGRKERCTPLRKETVKALSGWLRERQGEPTEPLFPNSRGGTLSADGVQYLLAKHVTTAAARCASLHSKRVTPHVLRHTAAMNLLHYGVDSTVIALWLGHEQVETTQMYLHASLDMKERTLQKIDPYTTPGTDRFRPDDRLLEFLDNL